MLLSKGIIPRIAFTEIPLGYKAGQIFTRTPHAIFKKVNTYDQRLCCIECVHFVIV